MLVRKLVFVVVVAIASFTNFSTASPSSYVSPEPDSNAPACHEVGNVSASADDGTVTIINYNNYRVTVIWAVYGHAINGSRHKVGGGTDVINAYEAKSNGSPAATCKVARKYNTNDQYLSYSVDIKVQRCD